MQLSAFPFSTILFDLDGTLVDSAPDVLEAIAAVLRDAGDPVPRMALSIIGPINSALYGDETFLLTNATLDLVTSMVLASSSIYHAPF